MRSLDNYEISNLGRIRKLSKSGSYVYSDSHRIINRNLNREVMFEIHFLKNTVRRRLVDTLVFSFLGLDLQSNEYKIEFIDNDYTNVNTSNITITSRNFRDINKRKIQKACEFSYKNSITMTNYEKVFFKGLQSVLSSYQVPKIEVKDIPTHYIENFNKKFYKLVNLTYRSSCIPQKVLFSSSSFYILDFYIPSLKIGFEIDGLHHYFNYEQLSYDNFRDDELLDRYEVKIIRIKNPELDNDSSKFILDRIDSIYNEFLMMFLSKKLGRLIDNTTVKFNTIGGSYFWNKLEKYSSINL